MKILKSSYILLITLFIIVIGAADNIYAAPELYGIEVYNSMTDSGNFYSIDTTDGTQTLIGEVPPWC